MPNGDSPFVALTGRGAGAYVRWGLSSEVQREVDYNAVSIGNGSRVGHGTGWWSEASGADAAGFQLSTTFEGGH